MKSHRAPFVHPDVGRWWRTGRPDGPIIDVRLKPEESYMFCEFTLTSPEARELAASLRTIPDDTQRAGWTRRMLADVRKHYLPDATDDEIRDRLDALTERLGERIHGVRGQLAGHTGVSSWPRTPLPPRDKRRVRSMRSSSSLRSWGRCPGGWLRRRKRSPTWNAYTEPPSTRPGSGDT